MRHSTPLIPFGLVRLVVADNLHLHDAPVVVDVLVLLNGLRYIVLVTLTPRKKRTKMSA